MLCMAQAPSPSACTRSQESHADDVDAGHRALVGHMVDGDKSMRDVGQNRDVYGLFIKVLSEHQG